MRNSSFILYLGAMLAAPIVGLAKEPPTGQQLFERHLEAVGGRAVLMAQPRLTFLGKIELPTQGIHGTIEWHHDTDGRFLYTTHLTGIGAFREGFDGEVFWKSDPIAGARLADPADLELLRRDSDSRFDANYARYFSEFGTPKATNYEGQPAWVVTTKTVGGIPERWYYSVQTGLRIGLHSERTTNGRRTPHEVSFADYRTVGRGRGPFTTRAKDFVIQFEEVLEASESFPDLSLPDDVRRALLPKRLAGVVIREGAPVPGAEVRVVTRRDTRSGPIITHSREWQSVTKADDEGRFSLDGLEGEEYVLTSVHGHHVGYLSGSLDNPEGLDALRMSLEPGVRVEGRVVDGEGRPVAGAHIHAGRGCFRHGSREAGRDGEFYWVLTKGHTDITVTADGYLSATQALDVPVGRSVRKTWTLSRAAAATGRVHNAAGAPISGVRLSLTPNPVNRLAGPADATSDAEGRFTFQDVKPGQYTLLVTNRGDQAPQTVVVPFEALDITLAGHSRVYGRVLDDKANPRADAEIVLFPGTTPKGADTWMTRTDPQGNFGFADVPAGPYVLRAYLRDLRHTDQKIDVPDKGDLPIDLVFAGGMSIRGRVLGSDGRPLVSAVIEGTRARGLAAQGDDFVIRNTNTDSKGRFVLENLTPGPYEVRAARESPKVRGFVTLRTVRAYAGSQDVEIVLPHRVVVTGRVLDSEGHAVPTARVGRFGRCDGAGVFAVPVAPGTQSELAISAAGFASRSIHLGELKGVEHNLGDVPLARGVSVRVRVLDAGTREPIRQAELRPENSAPLMREVWTTDALGSVTVPAVGSDGARIRIGAEGYLTHQVVLTSKRQDVEVLLHPGATIRGRILGVSGPSATRILVDVSSDPMGIGIVDAQGRFEITGVPRGIHQVHARGSGEPGGAPQHFTRAQVEVRDEGVHEVELKERTGGATIVVSITDERGNPLEVQVSLLPKDIEIPKVGRDVNTLTDAYGIAPEGQRPFGAQHELQNIPTGPYQLWIWQSIGAQIQLHTQPLTVSTEEQLKVKVDFPSNAKVLELLDL